MKPKAPIRRFDVFAEYNRQKAIEDGTPPDEAEGYGLWVAKVVASGGARHTALKQKPPEGAKHAGGETPEEEAQAEPKEKWHTLSGQPQTDELFEHEIVDRMGREFYHDEFVPAIRDALREGRSYQSIRDTIRRQWS